jgi:2-oxoisovalerate dehydrogenase E1 component
MSALSATDKLHGLSLLELMMLSREGDRREGILLRQSKGWFQVSAMGHEALAASVLCLNADDYIFPYYRDRALMLARGISNYELALAYFAKRDSSSAGRQMPGHYSDRPKNVFSVCTPTGGSLLPACGAAWGMKLEGKDSLCLATIGDAATRQGEFFEAVAFALQEKLPVIFLIEDNKYGISTPTERFLPYHLEFLSLEHVLQVDGRDPQKVFEATRVAAKKARRGDGPTVIWADIDRLSPHTSSDDHRIYRKLEDIAEMETRDPIKLLATKLTAQGQLDDSAFEEMALRVRDQVDRDYLRAEAEANPDAGLVSEGMFGAAPVPEQPPIQSGRQTMISAINSTLRKALEEDPKIVCFGEDIEDPKGGVFGVTKSLSSSFPNQVFNSPLAEATIMGVAVGMAAYGLKPVFELQFIDFVAPGWNQITTNMSTLRWRSNGEWKCPLVIYAPYGAYLPGGSLWHSQSNEASLVHAAGAMVAIPSTPEDAAGLFWTAIHADDPCFILVPKHILRKQIDVESVKPVPFGSARIVRAGSDVTLVTYGNTVELAQEAAEKCDASVEIIDLRSVQPCDYPTVAKSLNKTGRLVFVQEDAKTCGFGQCFIAEICSNPAWFNLLLSPPQLVAREDVPIGYNPIWEYAALPDVVRILSAIETVMA